MLTTVIKETTRSVHTELEKALIPALKKISSPVEYAEILKLFYGYFRPVETAVFQYIDQGDLPDISTRRKSNWLESDLEQMKQDLPVHRCENIPQINSRAGAWGALYVLEGSTLGGKIISKMIASRLPEDDLPLHFFQGYGDDTMHRWHYFLQSMTNSITTGEEQEEATGVATETFKDFKNWVDTVLYVRDQEF